MGLTQKLGTIPLAVFTDSSNNVGIGGAANASFKLQVSGSVNLEGNVTTTGAQFVQNGFYLTNTNAGATAGYTNLWGATDGIFFGLRNGTGGGKFIFQSATSYDYTFPAATGTLALTSNLSAYLPLTGGTLTGALSGTSATFNQFISDGSQFFSYILRGRASDNFGAFGFYSNNGATRYGYIQSGSTNGGQVVLVGDGGGSVTLDNRGMNVTGAATFSSSVSGTSIRSSAIGSFGFNTANNGEFQIYGTAADGMLIAGRGSTNDLVLLNKNGSDVLRVPTGTTTVSLQSLTGSGSRAVLADASGNLSAPVSDISVKENIKPIGYGLNEISKMNPVWFEFIDDYKNYGECRQNGNIAQEMQMIIPEAVFVTPSTGKMGINYDQLHAVYIKAIQELKAEIDELKALIAAK